MFEPKSPSLIPHSVDTNSHNPPQKVSVKHHYHVKIKRHQVLVTNSLPNQILRGTNIQIHPWSPFLIKNKCRVRPKWPIRRRKFLTWNSHVSSHVPYSYWLSIQLPISPRILAGDPIWIHRSNYKQACATTQVKTDVIRHHQIMWWLPQATNTVRLP